MVSHTTWLVFDWQVVVREGVAGRAVLLSEAFGCEIERVEVPCVTYPYPHTHCLCACVRGAREGRTNERTDGRRDGIEGKTLRGARGIEHACPGERSQSHGRGPAPSPGQ